MTKVHEVVISGVAGLFPECNDFDDFTNKILEGVNLVTSENCRWPPGMLGVPDTTGKMKTVYEFDLGLFGISRRLIEIMDPNTRLSIMQSFRAVCDAGYDPVEISGTNTAVFMSSFTSDTEDDFITRNANLGTYGILANSRSMQANRVSFFLNLVGPSNQLDSSWCGGTQAIMHAHDLISRGLCDAAIIGSSSLNLKAEMAVHYQALGSISDDGVTRSFSADATGYGRSEAVVAMFLQRARDARRSYGTILGAYNIYHGLRPTSFLEFSQENLVRFLKECYANAGVSPNDVAYLEASGTASKIVDAKELNGLASVLCNNRENPLLIGSVKSLVGHPEGAASLVSLVKALVALDRGIIAPNINYSAPNPNVPALVSGKMQVVTKATKFEGDIIAVNEIGLSGGAMSHIIVKRNPKPKRKDIDQFPKDNIPRLITLCDRTEENLENSVNRLENSPVDEELVYLLNSLNRKGLKGNLYRGYTILDSSEANIYKLIEKCDDKSKDDKRPVWFLFSGMGSQWTTMGKTLLRIPVFAKTIQRCHKAMETVGIDLINILVTEDPTVFDSILNSFVGIAAIQIGLIDVLREVGIVPDGMIGHSVGELGCSYADGVLTLEQVMFSAYARGRASIEATLIKGTMAAVGLGYSAIKDKVPATVDVACHNSSVSCTLSGPSEDMKVYIESLKNEGLFAKLVNVANIAYHSRYIKPAGPLLLNYLKPTITEPKMRSSKWISTSIPESQWHTNLAQTGSAEYFTNNLLSPVLFEEGAKHVPANAILIEIAPHGLLQAIVRKSHPKATHIPLTSRFDADNAMYLLSALGKLYINEVELDINKLYPEVSLPVSRSTIPLGQFYSWQCLEQFTLDIKGRALGTVSAKQIPITMREAKYSFFSFHHINNHLIIPNSFYVSEVLKQFYKLKEKKQACVQFEGLKFIEKTEVPLGGGNCDIFIELHDGTGQFCIIRGDDGAIIVAGKLTEVDFPNTIETNSQDGGTYTEYEGQEVISFLASYGLNLENKFASIKSVALNKTGFKGVVRWNGGLVEFLNGVFSLIGFYYTKLTNVLQTVENVELMTVDTGIFNNSQEMDFEVHYDNRTCQLKGVGIRMLLPEPKFVDTENFRTNTTFDTHRFVPYQFGEIGSGQLAASICYQLIIENALIPTDTWTKIKVISVGSNLFHDSLLALSKSSEQIELETVASEQILLEEDHSSLRGQVVWIVSCKPISSELIDALKPHTLKTYVLVPKISEATGDSEMFTFSSSFEKYALSSVPTNVETNVEIVRLDGNYVKNLETKVVLANEKNLEKGFVSEFVYLVGKIDSPSTIHEIMDDTKNLPHHNLLRYVLVESGDNSVNLENGTVKKCVEKGLKTNVIFNGVWGSIRTFPEKSISAGTVMKANDTVYNLSNVVQPKEPLVLGLNLNDVTGTLENDEIGALDYANSKTMGVATYCSERKIFVTDEELKWSKPDKWSVSEAATVPFLYSMATYILNYKNAEMEENSILINRGLLPISQALITLALNRAIEVFTTVNSDDEKKQLLSLHPKLKGDNVLDANSSTFHINILRKTNGAGVSKVVNTFKEQEMIKPCIHSVSYLGLYIGVSLAPANDKLKMGMSIFLSEVLAVGITPESILNLPKEEKSRLRDAVNKELVKGHVTPFSKVTVVTSDSTNKDAEKLLKTAKTKVIVKIDGKCQENVNALNCLTDDNIIIVNDRDDCCWIELCSWLSGRGARNITVALKDPTIDGMSSMRLSTLKDKYNSLNLSFVTTECCTSEKSVKKFIDGKNNGKKLHSLFVLSSENRQLVNLLGQSLEKIKCAMICIGNGGERICEIRNKMGLVSLCVRVGGNDVETNGVFDHLDNLLNQSRITPIVTMKQQADTGIVSGGVESLIPRNLNELHQLLQSTSSKPKFVEVQTKGPRKLHSQEVLPVFVFPGLRPQQLRRILRFLYFPALEVRLPSDITDITVMASAISNEMIKMPQNMFTLLADGWGGILALHVAANLEANNKITRVILIDSRPSLIVSEASQALADPIALFSRYINVPNKAKQKLNQVTSWKETVDTIMKESKMKKYEEDLIVQSLELLRNRLLGVAGSPAFPHKLKRPCYLFKIGEVNTMDQCGLEKYLKKPAIIRVLVLSDESDISEWTADEVNSLVMHENPDAAYLPKDEFLDNIFLKGKSKVQL